jgi:hypothetical protein
MTPVSRWQRRIQKGCPPGAKAAAKRSGRAVQTGHHAGGHQRRRRRHPDGVRFRHKLIRQCQYWVRWLTSRMLASARNLGRCRKIWHCGCHLLTAAVFMRKDCDGRVRCYLAADPGSNSPLTKSSHPEKDTLYGMTSEEWLLHIAPSTALTDFVNGLLSCLHSRCRAHYFVPRRRMDAGHRWVRRAGDRTRRRRLNKLSCAGWVPHDRGFVLGLPHSKDERRSGDRLITAREGSPPRPCLQLCAPATLCPAAPHLVPAAMVGGT